MLAHISLPEKSLITSKYVIKNEEDLKKEESLQQMLPLIKVSHRGVVYVIMSLGYIPLQPKENYHKTTRIKLALIQQLTDIPPS